MDRRRNFLIGVVVGVLIVGASVAATGFTRRLLSPFRIITAHKSSGSATAPELTPGDWINSEPLTLKGLRGRVVLIDFWTFGCYNCRNTLPFVKRWDARYREKGFTVIGVHSPEFDYEREVEHLRSEVASLGIRYPVVSDNDYRTWDSYNVGAWPTVFLLDKQGRIRWSHVGEGGYDEAERIIQKLLAEKEKSGGHIEVEINGNAVIKFDDADKPLGAGRIGLRSMEGVTMVTYDDFKVWELIPKMKH